MAPAAIGDHLDIRLESSAFPVDRLRVRKLAGREAVGQLYTFDVVVECLDPAGIDIDAVAGAEATLVFELGGSEVRQVHGMIVEADDHLGDTADTRVYRLRLAPRAYRMEMIRTYDVFVGVSVPELIQQKLALVGLDEGAALRLTGSYPARELIVQYDETDLALVCRLAEHLGISLFFESQGGLDTVVFTDNADGFQPTAGAGSVLYRGGGEGRDVFAVHAERRVVPTFYAVREYDYNHPLLDLTADHQLSTGLPGGFIEQGSNHRTPAQGQSLARVRAEEQESRRLVYTGRSDRCELTAGARFQLEGHPDLDAMELLVVSVEHEAVITMGGPESPPKPPRVSGDGSMGDEPPRYRNTFRAIPAASTYRPPRVTPRPRIGGLVTGVIDAAITGGQAYAPIDAQGRYRVHFLFDTTPAGARPVSCPVRMLQNHVGENYGTHFPLRSGTEVLVGFVNGDPDRPAIVGAVPNPLKPSPVTGREPSAHRMQTASGIKIEIVDQPSPPASAAPVAPQLTTSMGIAVVSTTE
jgi:type VI secretion system secreted protein VgrG